MSLWRSDPEYLQLFEKLKRDFSNLKIHHDLGLKGYAYAIEQADLGNYDVAYDAWQSVIAHWMPLFEDSSYWKNWVAERADVYGTSIDDDNVTSVKSNLRQHLRDHLQGCDDALSQDNPDYIPLTLQMDVEVQGVQIVKQLQLRSDEITGAIIGGRLMTLQYDFLPLITERIQSTLQEPTQSDSLDDLLGGLIADDYRQIMTEKQIEQVSYRFSALGYVKTALDQQRIGLAKRLFDNLPEMPEDSIFKVFTPDSIDTYYVQQRDIIRADLTLSDAFGQLSNPDSSADTIASSFLDLLIDAQKTGHESELHERIIKALDEHSEAADDQRKLFLADVIDIMLERFPDKQYGHKLALGLLESSLAIVRGGSLEEGVVYLERAYAISPRVHRIYHNMGLVRRAQASNAFKEANGQSDYLTSLRYLNKARDIYAEVLTYDPEAEDAKEQIKEIDDEIEVVKREVGDPLEDYLGSYLAGECESDTDKLLEIMMITSGIEASRAKISEYFGDQPDSLTHHLANVLAYRANDELQLAIESWATIATQFPQHAYHANLEAGLILLNKVENRQQSLRYFALALQAATDDEQRVTAQIKLVKTLFFLKDFIRMEVIAKTAAELETDENRARKLTRVTELASELIEKGELNVQEDLELAAILANIENAVVITPPATSLERIADMLEGKLRYTQEADHIWVAFRSDGDESVGVSVTLDGEYVVCTCRPVGITPMNHDDKLYMYLFMTFDIDFISVQWKDDHFVLVSKFWSSEFAESDLLDTVIRFIASISELEDHITVEQVEELRQRYMTSLSLKTALANIADPDRKPEAVRDRVGNWAQRNGISVERLAERRERLHIRTEDRTVNVTSIYKLHGISFVASYDLNVQRGTPNREILIEMAKINSQTGILRIAIDRDGDMGVLYETPYLNEEILEDMHAKYKEWLSGNLSHIYGMGD